MKVFISYRRRDSHYITDHIYDSLVPEFGREDVFKDINSIPYGRDFRQFLQDAVTRCDVLLVVIGPRWLGETDAAGRRRVDDPQDWVRVEIEAALTRDDIPVIPLLVDGASLPRAEDLPPSLRGLIYRHGMPVRPDPDFRHDMERLIQALRALRPRIRTTTGEATTLRGPAGHRPGTRPIPLGIALFLVNLCAIILIILTIYISYHNRAPPAGQAGGTSAVPAPVEEPGPPKPAEPPGVRPQRPAMERRFTNSVGMTLVRIEPGTFTMGTTDAQIDRLLTLFPDAQRVWFADETPPHSVRITRAFYLGVHEVTVGQFRQFIEEAGYRTEAERDGQGSWGWDDARGQFIQDPKYTWRAPGFPQTDGHPVVNVSWNDAQAFCEWLTTKEGDRFRYRLPTEAEWEYACRAGGTTLFPMSDDPESLAAVGNVADASLKRKDPNWEGATIRGDDGHVYTAPVGSYAANAWGLYDMVGNVWEWCSDSYNGASTRVFRGGSWRNHPGYCRPAARGGNAPGFRCYFLGFRLAAVQE